VSPRRGQKSPDEEALEAMEAMARTAARPEKSIRVVFRGDSEDFELTGQIRIGDGCMLIYRDLPGGDFLTICGIPLSSIEFWEEIPEPETGVQDAG
jgi:hypothetical protein